MDEKLKELLLKAMVSIRIAAQLHHEAGEELDRAAEELKKVYLEAEGVGDNKGDKDT